MRPTRAQIERIGYALSDYEKELHVQVCSALKTFGWSQTSSLISFSVYVITEL